MAASFIAIIIVRDSIVQTSRLSDEINLLAAMESEMLDQASVENHLVDQLLFYTPFEVTQDLENSLDEAAACSGAACFEDLADALQNGYESSGSTKPIDQIVVEAVADVIQLVPGCDAACFSPEAITDYSEQSGLTFSANPAVEKQVAALMKLAAELGLTGLQQEEEEQATAGGGAGEDAGEDAGSGDGGEGESDGRQPEPAEEAATATPAPTQIQSTTIIQGTYMYSGPKETFTVAGFLNLGVQVTVLAAEGNGFWITDIPGRPGVIAWVNSEATDLNLSIYKTQAPTPVPTVTELSTIRITRDTLGYFGPGSAYGTVGSLANGLELPVVGIANGYWVVEMPGRPGVTAWVRDQDTNLPTSAYTGSGLATARVSTPIPTVVPPRLPTGTQQIAASYHTRTPIPTAEVCATTSVP